MEHSSKSFKGYIQVYTGNGKGKTTAALGLAIRAAGYNYKTYMGQFLKGQSYGELKSIKHCQPLITIEQFGRKGFIHVTKNPDQEDIERAKKGLKKCLKAMLSRKYTLIILDDCRDQTVHFIKIQPYHFLAYLCSLRVYPIISSIIGVKGRHRCIKLSW